MRTAMLSLLMSGGSLVCATPPKITPTLPLDAQFEAWNTHYGHTYATDDERARRFAIFSATAERVHAHNAKFAAGESTCVASSS